MERVMKRWAIVITFLTISAVAMAQTSAGTTGGTSSGSSSAATPAANNGSAPTGAGMQNTPAGMQAATGVNNSTAAGVQPITSSNGTTGINSGNGSVVGTTANGGAVFVTPVGQTGVAASGVASGTAVAVPAMVTPLVHLGVASGQVGASSATPGNMAGATNSTLANVPAPAPIGIVTEVQNAVPVGVQGASNGAATNTIYVVNGRTLLDRGVANSGAVAGDDGTHGRSLGEIARDLRQQNQNLNARTFTNADVQRVANSGGGMSGAATAAAGNNSGYPANNGVINPNAVAQPTGSTGAATGTTQGGVAQPSAPAPTNENNVPPADNAQPQKPSAAAPHEMAAMQAPANPAEQAAQQQATDNSGNNGEQRTLPKSGTLLPLIALVGVAATAAGLLAR